MEYLIGFTIGIVLGWLTKIPFLLKHYRIAINSEKTMKRYYDQCFPDDKSKP